MIAEIIENIPNDHIEAWRYLKVALVCYPECRAALRLMSEVTDDMLTDMRTVNKRSVKSKLYFDLSKISRSDDVTVRTLVATSDQVDVELRQMPEQRRKRSILPLLEKVVELMIACDTCEDLQSVGYALEDLIEGLIHKP